MDYTKQKYSSSYSNSDTTLNQGLRDYMIAIYRNMCIALLITAAVSYSIAESGLVLYLVSAGPLAFIVMLAPIGFVMYMTARFEKMSYKSAQTSLWIFSGLIGLSLSSIFLVYTASSIARTFLIAATVFGSMSIYGYSTKRNLSSLGSFLIMGVWGLFIAGIVNIFMQSPAIYFITSFVGVLVFTGMVAYESQSIKDMYYRMDGDTESAGKISVFASLSLYMSFVNLFLYLLRFFGDRRN